MLLVLALLVEHAVGFTNVQLNSMESTLPNPAQLTAVDQSPQQRRHDLDRSLGAQLLTTVAADATLIVMNRGVDSPGAAKLDRLGIHGTDAHACPAFGALCGANERIGDYETTRHSAGASRLFRGREREPIDNKLRIHKRFDWISEVFNVLVCSQTEFHSVLNR